MKRREALRSIGAGVAALTVAPVSFLPSAPPAVTGVVEVELLESACIDASWQQFWSQCFLDAFAERQAAEHNGHLLEYPPQVVPSYPEPPHRFS